MHQEVELKLALPRRALAALRRHPLIVDGSTPTGRAVTLENTYYDTAALALKSRKVALRTRRQGRKWLQTVKCASQSTGGLTSRPEWEQPFADGFDFSAIDNSSVRKLLLRHANALIPVFSTRFRRETRVYAPREGTRILIMIDTGTVIAGERSEPICEVELELETGAPLDLLDLAAVLARDLPLLPNDTSKAERGYRLHLGLTAKAARAEASGVDASMTPLDAFRDLAFACLRQWQANVAGATDSNGPEFIHQLRVSQRRLRSLLRIFAPALPGEFVSDWLVRLRENANRFGDARDLDVLDEELLSPVRTTNAGDDALIARLRARVEHERASARQHAQKALDPAEQGRLLIELTRALHGLPGNDLISSVDLPSFAALQLERLRKRARKRLAAARDLVPEHLHALRIALKQLRYGAEFFAPLMPTGSADRYLRTLTKVQNDLGFINDLDVARLRFATWAADDTELRVAAAHVCGWHSPRYQRLSKRTIRDVAPLLARDTPWAALTRRPASAAGS